MIRAAVYFPLHQKRLGGGDWVQVQRTVQAIQRSGAVQIELVHHLPPLEEFDLLHVFNLLRPEDLLEPLAAAWQAHIPVVLSSIYWDDTAYRLRGRWQLPDPADPLGRLSLKCDLESLRSALELRRAIVRSVAGIAALSQRELDRLCEQFEPPSECAKRVIRNGIDPLFFHGDPERFLRRYGLEKFVLTVGRIEDRKNQLAVIHAAQQIGVPCVVVGSPFEQVEYYRACREAATRYTLFIDRMTPEDLADAYAAAAAFVLPSWLDPAPLVCLEAAAAGCPVVTTSYGGIAEYLGDLCWLCDPGSVESIAAAIEAAMNAQGLREDIRERVKTFTWEAAAQETVDFYLAVLEHGPIQDPSWLSWLSSLQVTLESAKVQNRLAAIVANYSARISERASEPVSSKVLRGRKRSPLDLRGELTVGGMTGQVRRREQIRILISLRNTGNDVWPDAAHSPWPVNVGYQWKSGKRTVPEGRCYLPGPVRPGEAVEWEDAISTPHAAGTYLLLIALVHEDHGWSYQLGGPSATFSVEVV